MANTTATMNRMKTLLSQYANPVKLASLLRKKQTDRGRERYRRAGITASASFLSKALALMISFVSVPLTIHYLGAERYGVWLTISSLLVWMSLTDFGLTGNALVNMLSKAHGNDDRASAQQYAASAFWALLGLGTIMTGIFAITFRWIPWRTLFRVSDALPTQELQLACALMLATFVFGLPLSMLNSVYSAYQDGFIWNIWQIAGNGLSLVALIIVTRFRGGLPDLILAVSGTRTLVQAANAVYMFARQYPFLRPVRSAVRWSCIREITGLGLKYMVTQLAGLGIYQSQPMIITQVLGPAQVAVFVIAQKIITLPIDLAYIGTAPFISAFGEARARQDWNWIRGAFKNSMVASIGLSLAIQAVIAIGAQRVIAIWAGAEAMPMGSLVIWLSIYTFFAAATMPIGQVLCGLERAEVLAWSLSICAVAIIVLSVVFAHWWGLTGVAAAMAAGKLSTSIPIQLREIGRIFRRGQIHLERQEAVPSTV